MREFHGAADSIRGFLNENAERQRRNAAQERRFRDDVPGDERDRADDARRAAARDEWRRHTL